LQCVYMAIFGKNTALQPLRRFYSDDVWFRPKKRDLNYSGP
jgi:hypothetical protein